MIDQPSGRLAARFLADLFSTRFLTGQQQTRFSRTGRRRSPSSAMGFFRNRLRYASKATTDRSRGHMLQDYRLGLRMLLKYPGLTLAGGLALAIAIGVGAGWYDVIGQIVAPTIPLPEGDRIVTIETRNTLTNEPEPRVLRDFLEWRRGLHTIEHLGAYRTASQNLVVGNTPPEPIQVAEMTAAAFATARVPPLLGRAILDSDEMAGAPQVVVLGYDAWQRSLGGREDVLGSVVTLGDTPATVIGVMPKGFGYPFNHDAWTPLSLRTSYEALEGGAIGIIGRLAGGVSRQQADAELRVFGERTAAALPVTHAHLRPRVVRLAAVSDDLDIAQFALRNLPALLVLAIACLSVGTLIYARTATREGEIAVRSALGASRARIMGQLFVETLVLTSVAAPIGLIAADRALAWGIDSANKGAGGAPFWMTPGLQLSTILYAGGLALVSAAMLSLLPALKVTRARLQPHLANLGSGGATLRFGRVWTGAMLVQVALTAMGIPAALESVNQTRRKVQTRAQFPSREYLAARIDVGRPLEGETTSAFQARRALTFEALARRVAGEPGVVAVTYTDQPVGVGSRSICRSRVVLRRQAPLLRWISDDGGGSGLLRDVRSADGRRAWVPPGRHELERPNRHRQRGVRACLFARDGHRFADRRPPAVCRAVRRRR